MAKDEEDWHGLQMTDKLEKVGLKFSRSAGRGVPALN